MVIVLYIFHGCSVLSVIGLTEYNDTLGMVNLNFPSINEKVCDFCK